MSALPEILRHNAEFVAQRKYEPYLTTAYPDKKLVIITCMDTRLSELLPRAMNINQGDAKIIKVAGAVVAAPFGSVMRSILIAVYELGAAEVLVVGHHGCGMITLSAEKLLAHAVERGIPAKDLDLLRAAGIDLDRWLGGFDSEADAVGETVRTIRSHPLFPRDVAVHGLLMHPETGQLERVTPES